MDPVLKSKWPKIALLLLGAHVTMVMGSIMNTDKIMIERLLKPQLLEKLTSVMLAF